MRPRQTNRQTDKHKLNISHYLREMVSHKSVGVWVGPGVNECKLSSDRYKSTTEIIIIKKTMLPSEMWRGFCPA